MGETVWWELRCEAGHEFSFVWTLLHTRVWTIPRGCNALLLSCMSDMDEMLHTNVRTFNNTISMTIESSHDAT